MKWAGPALAITLATITPPGLAAEADSGDSPWYSRLPFLAEEARKRGHELPLPFGAALVVTGLDGRKIEVTDTRIALDGNPGQSISNFVDLGSTSQVFNANLKFDAWVLPFLNVYALVGYVHNNSDTHARITVLPGGPGSDAEITTSLDGMVGGVGLTMAGGYKQLFVVADYNYNKADLGFDENFTASIASLRAGWMGKISDHPTQLWVGVGNWDTAATAKGHGTLEDGTTVHLRSRPETEDELDVRPRRQFRSQQAFSARRRCRRGFRRRLSIRHRADVPIPGVGREPMNQNLIITLMDLRSFIAR